MSEQMQQPQLGPESPQDFLSSEPTEKQMLSAIYGIVLQMEQKLDQVLKEIGKPTK
jgi:hypothetical protein